MNPALHKGKLTGIWFLMRYGILNNYQGTVFSIITKNTIWLVMSTVDTGIKIFEIPPALIAAACIHTRATTRHLTNCYFTSKINILF